MLVLLPLLLASPEVRAEVPTDCGEVQPTVPDFQLPDANENSATFGQTLGAQDFRGKTLVLYFAHASCGVCQSHAKALQEIWDEHPDWAADTQILIVNMPGYDSYLPELVEGVQLPVLQDDDTQLVSEGYGAYKWYIYFVDDGGTLRWLHYDLSLTGSEAERFVLEVEQLRAEP